jgi:hypothetical protein
MQANGTINIKLVVRKLQNSNKATQFMMLAGFTPLLSHTTADFVESLSPNEHLSQAEIDENIAKFVKLSNAAAHKDITNPAVTKKLDKLFGTPSVMQKGVDSPFSSAIINT